MYLNKHRGKLMALGIIILIIIQPFVIALDYIWVNIIIQIINAFLLFLFGYHYDAQRTMALKDYLTGLHNRRFAYEIFGKYSDMSTRNEIDLSIAVIDLNNFKEINDNFGHKVGDETLKQFAKTLKKYIRNEDVVVRWGGDEFVILAPSANPIEMNKIIDRIANKTNVSFSYGLSNVETKDTTLDHVVRRADISMYKNKNIK